ncbi:MAG: heterodisulfide reductase-related iron-sulfur binding cluster [Candidatus Marinimicrobia bacterium]|jgi:Fe-S oxidoreductase|nr:heterodisulfide reductase-related iron-sulfur binding cluster [Candidatus Neomarinimicrobiota bacterium]MDP7059712.1 heterodisulfide reductase-related iron-sulfur binding cluster [Candidatus Neomarinimicrobiota bacterium]|tara:strand:+ start:2070 stop:3941 length:1872 start_codon:yes stop_codon:yes gene_type:complete
MQFSVLEKIVISVLSLATLSSFGYEVWKRLSIVLKGLGGFPLDRFAERLWRAFREVLIHERVIRDRLWPGLMHAFVFWGFIAFGIVTLDHFAIGFNRPLLSEVARHSYSFMVIPVALFVLIGICSLSYRRFVIQPDALGKHSPTSGLVAVFIALLMLTYLYGEMSPPAVVVKMNWWLHSLLILAFLILIPRSKHLHLVFAPFNIFFRPFDTPVHQAVSINLEAEEEELDAMLADLTRLTKNQALDIFSCVECGRCTDACPVQRGGGVLNPKHHFILDLRQPLLDSGDVNVLDQINVEAGWECTTCQACTYACPVGNQVEKSDEIRRLQVMVEGQVPQEYQKLFMNLQETGNTEGAFSSSLADRLPKFTPDKEYVLWLGCFARYNMDPNYTKSVENYAKILDVAGVSYGVLEKEWCSGDPANRLGEKMTYQLLMEHNLEQLSSAKKVTTMCPHCAVNIGKEYRKYGDVPYEVEHHTQVISSLIEDGRLPLSGKTAESVTYHDPCNLSRILEEVDAPRKVIKATAENFFELEESGKKTLCCGAGGGLWWKKEGTGRTHLVRAEQIMKSGAETVVTGCNFCYGMFNQGLGPMTPEGGDPVKVKDLAELVAENIDSPSNGATHSNVP